MKPLPYWQTKVWNRESQFATQKSAKTAQYVSDEFSHKSVSITVAGVPAGTMEVTHIN